MIGFVNGCGFDFCPVLSFKCYLFSLSRLINFSCLYSLFYACKRESYCVGVSNFMFLCYGCSSLVLQSTFSYLINLFNYHYFDLDCSADKALFLTCSPFFIVIYSVFNVKLLIFRYTTVFKTKLVLLKVFYLLQTYTVAVTRFFCLVQSNMYKLRYILNFFTIKTYITFGTLTQCQLSKFNLVKTNCNGWLFLVLCLVCDCFCFYFNSVRLTFISFTPEILCMLDSSKVFLYPIAGTLYRGSSLFVDKYREMNLYANTKELSEHLMLIDLSRNDLSRFSVVGSQRFVFRFKLVRFYYVYHIVSCLSAGLASDTLVSNVLKCISPVGTVSGSPKRVAMTFISKYEVMRGFYAGALGLLDLWFNRALYFVLIRTLFIVNYYCYIRSASGIVLKSLLYNEYYELNNKLLMFLKL